MECKGIWHLMETEARVCFFSIFLIIGEGEDDLVLYFSRGHCQEEVHSPFLLTFLVNSLIMMRFLQEEGVVGD